MKRRDFAKLAVPVAFAGITDQHGFGQLRTAGNHESTKQFGAERLDFVLSASRAFLIKPIHIPSGSKPWLWYAPAFMGKHPSDPSINPTEAIHPTDIDTPPRGDRKDRTTNAWLFTRLLANGFHIAGIEVGESYGNPAGRKHFTELYGFLLNKHALSPKACLYPQSRGGLMLYNWAVEHPDSVQCVAGNQPVCDLRSYPGLEKASPAYEMSATELEHHLQEHNPIARIAPLAARKVPILHVHGDQDKLVPLETNTMELARAYKASGGEIEVIVAKGVGHGNWPELFEKPRVLDFLLAQVKGSNR